MNRFNSFHNTISSTEPQFERDARNQDQIVLDWFKDHPKAEVTPFEVWQACFTGDTPVTSVRRAISNLTKKGRLIKTGKRRLELYGKDNYCWKLNL